MLGKKKKKLQNPLQLQNLLKTKQKMQQQLNICESHFKLNVRMLTQTMFSWHGPHPDSSSGGLQGANIILRETQPHCLIPDLGLKEIIRN